MLDKLEEKVKQMPPPEVIQVNQTAARTSRAAVKKWQKLAASVEKNHSTNDELVDQRMLVSGDSPTRF